MPKIAGPDIATHRKNQRRTILEAARGIVIERGAGALSVLAVAERSGIPRATVQYTFPTVTAIACALVDEAFEVWLDELHGPLDASTDPRSRVERYLRSCLAVGPRDDVRLAMALGSGELGEEVHARYVELYRRLGDPIGSAIEELGEPNAELVTFLVRGLITFATRAVNEGTDPSTVEKETMRLLAPVVGGPQVEP